MPTRLLLSFSLPAHHLPPCPSRSRTHTLPPRTHTHARPFLPSCPRENIYQGYYNVQCVDSSSGAREAVVTAVVVTRLLVCVPVPVRGGLWSDSSGGGGCGGGVCPTVDVISEAQSELSLCGCKCYLVSSGQCLFAKSCDHLLLVLLPRSDWRKGRPDTLEPQKKNNYCHLRKLR